MEKSEDFKNYNLFVVGFIFELALVGVAAAALATVPLAPLLGPALRRAAAG